MRKNNVYIYLKFLLFLLHCWVSYDKCIKMSAAIAIRFPSG